MMVCLSFRHLRHIIYCVDVDSRCLLSFTRGLSHLRQDCRHERTADKDVQQRERMEKRVSGVNV